MQNKPKCKTMELLAPAGGPEQLTAAVLCGADAVYFGYGAFNARRNAKNFTDEEFADIFTADKPVLFAYHSYAHDVRGLIYDRPNHDNFNVHGYEEQGSTTTPYDMVRVNNIDRYELVAEALRMIDADKYAEKIDELEAFRQEAFQFAVDNGYDHPDYTDWVYSGVNTTKQGAVSATAATAGDNE